MFFWFGSFWFGDKPFADGKSVTDENGPVALVIGALDVSAPAILAVEVGIVGFTDLGVTWVSLAVLGGAVAVFMVDTAVLMVAVAVFMVAIAVFMVAIALGSTPPCGAVSLGVFAYRSAAIVRAVRGNAAFAVSRCLLLRPAL